MKVCIKLFFTIPPCEQEECFLTYVYIITHLLILFLATFYFKRTQCSLLARLWVWPSGSLMTPVLKYLFCRWEKMLVVLLVAIATVGILTNLLILGVLLRQRGKLCLRYQILMSQACAGIFGTSVIIYPLKVRIFMYFLFTKIFLY